MNRKAQGNGVTFPINTLRPPVSFEEREPVILRNLHSTTGMPFQPHFLALDDTRTGIQSLLHAVASQLSSKAQPPLGRNSKSLGQIQILDPDYLMSGLKSNTNTDDTLPARPYSFESCLNQILKFSIFLARSSGAATDGLTHSISQALELLWEVCNYCDQRFETP